MMSRFPDRVAAIKAFVSLIDVDDFPEVRAKAAADYLNLSSQFVQTLLSVKGQAHIFTGNVKIPTSYPVITC